MFRMLGHLIVPAFTVFWRILFTGIVCAALGAGAVLVAAYLFTIRWQWPPSQMLVVLAVVVGVLAAYAGGVTVLMVEAARALKEGAKVLEQQAVAPIKAVGQSSRAVR
jgi:predicted lysophospholipase L1 biosynthesis ABC-type transport system permease subunit